MSTDQIEKLKENMKKEWEKIFDQKIEEAAWLQNKENVEKYFQFMTKIMNDAMTTTIQTYQKANTNMSLDNINAFRDSWIKNCEKLYEHAKQTQDFQKMCGNMLSQTLANWQAFNKV